MSERKTITYHEAVEVVAVANGLSVTQADAFLRRNIVSGAISLNDEQGNPLTADEFSERLAVIS